MQNQETVEATKKTPKPVSADLAEHTPEKAEGPAHAIVRRLVNSKTAVAPARASDVLAAPQPSLGATEQARATTGMQGSLGNARMERMSQTATLAPSHEPTPQRQTDTGAAGLHAPALPASDPKARKIHVLRQVALPPTTATPTGKRTGRPIAELEKEFHDLIAGARKHGWVVAVDNLEHFIAGKGVTRAVPESWLRGYGVVTGAENRNHARFEERLAKVAKVLADGASDHLSDYWDAAISAAPVTELYFASGMSQLKSTGSFSLTRAGPTVSITGSFQQRWFDKYDWNPGMGAMIPGYGYVSDDVGLDLKDAGIGHDYLLENLYTQTLTGTYTIRPWYPPDSSTFTWS